MSIYRRFCDETVDKEGRLERISFHYPDNFNFGYDVVDAISAGTPEKRAVVWCNTEGEEHFFSFSEVSDKSDRIASMLLDNGIKRGDYVIVSLKRHFEYWFTAVALHKIGAILVPVTHMLTESDFRYRITASRARAVICTPNDGVPEKILKVVSALDWKISLFSVQKDIPRFLNLTTELERYPRLGRRLETRVTDAMAMYFTSGTTGSPKGVIHDFSYPLAHIVTARYWQRASDGGLHFTISETGWAKASWGKIYGQWLVGSAVMVFDFDNFEPRQLTAVMNRYEVTSFCAPPTVYRYLVRKGMAELPSLRHASTAGEFLSSEVFRLFNEKTGLTLKEGYGQTETTLLAANYEGVRAVDGSMGKCSPLYDLMIVDEEGKECRDGEVGEIVIRMRDGRKPIGIFSSYLDNPELYEAAWRGGVYHTGDSAWKDEDGYFWFHGRFDDIIKSGGFRIGPSEIESVLIRHPAVLECTVIGIPDPLRGQAIKAYVVLSSGYAPSRTLEKDIRDYCNSALAEYKWIRALEFIPSLPKTISGKVIKAELRKRDEDSLEKAIG